MDLPVDLQGRVESGELAPSVAYEVSRLTDVDRQREIADRVVTEHMSRAETVEAVRRAAGRKAKAKGKPKTVLSRAWKTSAGVKVTLECRNALDDDAVVAALKDVLTQTRSSDDQAVA